MSYAAFANPDLARLPTAVSLRRSLRSYPSRPGRLLEQAKEFTGRTYRRGDEQRAVADLSRWINQRSA